ncbi:hypothetical protein OG426_30445 [Streptomyces canus]|uniref:hypothetical protein n=1 Tax=Streptomyces canus TaxID=58343 RepID=UPI00386EFBF8|nr:hypothetical protein OG426_30445 [Streptomyces canus]
MSSSLAEDLRLAVSDVMHAHGFGLVSRLVFVVELITEDSGELGLLRGSIPASMPVWDELGMHQYALADMQAVVTAARVADVEEE